MYLKNITIFSLLEGNLCKYYKISNRKGFTVCITRTFFNFSDPKIILMSN